MKKRFEFAKEWLHHQGIELYANKKQILKYNGGYYGISPLNTKIKVGIDFLENTEDHHRISTEKMRQLGVTIISVPTNDNEQTRRGWKKKQRRIFFPTRIRKSLVNEANDNYVKKNMVIMHDPFNRRIRVTGDSVGCSDGQYGNGDDSGWFYYDESSKPQLSLDGEDYINQQLLGWKFKSKESRIINIPELAFMVTEDNYLICLPKKTELQKAIWVTKTGVGKTFGMESFASRLIYKHQHRVGGIMDVQDQFYDMCLPNQNQGYLRELSRFGETPKPLPVINLYLSAPNLNIPNRDIDFRLVIEFRNFLARYGYFTFGIKKYDLGQPASRMSSLANAFKDCKTEEEIVEKMEENLPYPDKEAMQNLIIKWRDKFKTLFNEKVTSNLFEDGIYSLTMKKKNGEMLTGNPFIISLYAGLIPVINTSINRPTKGTIRRNYLASVLSDTLQWQITMGKNKKPIWIMADELQTLYEKGKGYMDNAAIALEEIFRQGRKHHIGFLGTTQSYLKLHDDIKTNLSHLFCGYIQTAKERKQIATDFELSKEEEARLGNMPNHHFLACTKEDFIVYDKFGKRSIVKGSDRAFVGKFLPPICSHQGA